MSHRPECSNGWILSECGVHANPSQVSDHANVSMSLLIIGQCDLSLYHHYTVYILVWPIAASVGPSFTLNLVPYLSLSVPGLG